jgi:hypothetical protein
MLSLGLPHKTCKLVSLGLVSLGLPHKTCNLKVPPDGDDVVELRSHHCPQAQHIHTLTVRDPDTNAYPEHLLLRWL